MFFNSLNFAFFLIIVFCIHWFIAKKSLKLQNISLLVASYFFYSCWDYRFLFLLIFSTFLDFYTGIKIKDAKNENIKKVWFWLSISINIGFLGVFKYFNFFVESFSDLLTLGGFHANFWTLEVILPVGISFYTFHGLSYVIDIYKNRIEAERNFIDYALFVSFFPLLVAGPIERATHLLPQFKRVRKFDYLQAVDGLRQILWGLFKKIVIADNCAQYANTVFNSSSEYSGSTHVVAAIFFAFQIYGDFSGYSDIAQGTAKLFGIDLLKNFAFPYFSRDIAEFWRRWHISLSSWFKDYLYIPLGGSNGGAWKKIRNTLIIFLVSGFWHGANWTFIVWGLLNALFIMPSILIKSNRKNLDIVAQGRIFANFKELLSILSTFTLTCFAWIFFRAKDLSSAFDYINCIFSKSLFSKPQLIRNELVWLLLIFIFIEWTGRENKYAIEKLGLKWNNFFRLTFYVLLAVTLIWFKNEEEAQFIYFQF